MDPRPRRTPCPLIVWNLQENCSHRHLFTRAPWLIINLKWFKIWRFEGTFCFRIQIVLAFNFKGTFCFRIEIIFWLFFCKSLLSICVLKAANWRHICRCTQQGFTKEQSSIIILAFFAGEAWEERERSFFLQIRKWKSNLQKINPNP